jgi:hypothetical protein
MYDPFLEETGKVDNTNGADHSAIGLDELVDEIAQTDTIFSVPQELQLEDFGTIEAEEAQQFQEYAQQNEEQLLGGDDEQPAEELEQEQEQGEEDEDIAEVVVVALPARGRRGRRGRAM